MTDRPSIPERYWDANVRVERLFLLAGCPDGEALPPALVDALDDGAADFLTDYVADSIGTGRPIDRDEMEEEWGYLLTTGRLPNLLAEVATPVASHFRTGEHGDSYRTSWGYYHTSWLCASDTDDLTAKAEVWASETLAHDKAQDVAGQEQST